MSETQTFELSLAQIDDFEFRIRFDGTELEALTTDESAPLGHNAGPNPARLLLASVANCLALSLLFSLRKFMNEPGQIKARASASMERNEDKRWRITHLSKWAVAVDETDHQTSAWLEYAAGLGQHQGHGVDEADAGHSQCVIKMVVSKRHLLSKAAHGHYTPRRRVREHRRRGVQADRYTQWCRKAAAACANFQTAPFPGHERPQSE